MPVPLMKPLALARRLLPVGLTLLTCACDTSGFVEDSTEEASLTLDATQPHVVKRLRLQGKTRKDARAKFTEVVLNVNSSVKWYPKEGTRTDVLPWYRIRMVTEQDGLVHDEKAFVMEPSSHHDYLYTSAGLKLEALPDSLDTVFQLEFDRQGAPSEGTFDVTWKAYATLFTDAGAPEDIQFTVTEESPAP
ncbi:hypothetical protein JYJ95_09290 [Corallococcus exiguus]|uniref:hypothetical protein n=1 Tax=Corallococcus exiguus TaxID=83462 RepID=UPI001A8E4823|nr:hypothetical protein [Corallococcus exiguus]MBN8466708.1 hypothetical protein [Corallococcus exiguus]